MAIEVVRRGVRLGVRIALVPVIFFGSLCLVGAVRWLCTGMHQGALEELMRVFTVVAGTLGVGVLLGAVTGGALALSPEWIAARAPLRGLLAGAVASVMWLGETAVVAATTGGGLMLLTLVSTPVAGFVAAAHSGDVLGRTHYHPWLCSQGHPG
jgi:hypothetical protein